MWKVSNVYVRGYKCSVDKRSKAGMERVRVSVRGSWGVSGGVE